MEPAPQTVVFDFDGVLVANDSTGELVKQRLFAKPWRVLPALPAVVALPLGWFRPSVHRKVSRYLIWLSGLEQEEAADDLVAAFGRGLARRPGWPVREAIDAVRAHLEAGDRVLVASASLEGCVRAYLDEVGLSEVIVLGSQLPSNGRGAVHMYHTEKVRAAEQSGWVTPWDRVYSDSIRDLPMFEVSRQVTLVNVGDRTFARVVEKVGSGVVVDRVRWG